MISRSTAGGLAPGPAREARPLRLPKPRAPRRAPRRGAPAGPAGGRAPRAAPRAVMYRLLRHPLVPCARGVSEPV